MRKSALWFVLLLALSVTTATAQDGGASRISLVVPKCNMFPNPDLKSDDVLFGLYSTNVGFLLLPSKISVTSGTDDRCAPYTRVDVNFPEEPLFLVKGLPDLKTGPIKTAFSGNKFLYPGEPVLLYLPTKENDKAEAKPQILRAAGNAVESGRDTLVYNYKIKLKDGDRSQALDFYRTATLPGTARPPKYGVLNLTEHEVEYDLCRHMELPTLIWAGDLDSDGKQDLFMWWPCPGKAVGIYSLYLSSRATDGNLVGKIPLGVRTYYSDCPVSGRLPGDSLNALRGPANACQRSVDPELSRN